MKKVISAGGIFVKKDKRGGYCLLLLRYKDWPSLGFLKGHLKSGEAVEQAALREIKEEAGLENVTIVEKIGEVKRKSLEDSGETVIKTIHLFLMTTLGFSHLKSEENYGWYEYGEAIGKMSFPEEAEFLRVNRRKILDLARKTK